MMESILTFVFNSSPTLLIYYDTIPRNAIWNKKHKHQLSDKQRDDVW